MTLARFRELGTACQWVADTLMAFALIGCAVLAFCALGIVDPPSKASGQSSHQLLLRVAR